ncbi:MAG TPA: SRPBCC family protein [Polyangiaceae bacterium]|nr:SRPBCC family protein [Polyangiaceae bacterium]
MNRKLLLTGSLLLALSSSVASASSDAQRYQVQTPFSDIKAGAAKTQVHAPLGVVHSVVTDFGRYAEHISKFEKAKVVGRHGDQTDVYLQVPILKGAAKVWAVVRFDAAKKTGSGDDEVIVGRMLKGNVKRLDATWHLSRVDDSTTTLDLELLIVPDFVIPVPGSLVSGEVAYAAEKAVVGLRSRSEALNAH